MENKVNLDIDHLHENSIPEISEDFKNLSNEQQTAVGHEPEPVVNLNANTSYEN